MPRIRLTKSAIDALPTSKSDVVYWDTGCPGFGVKVTPNGRKVFIVLYRTGGAGSKLRKYTIGPYGRVTLHQARVAAQKVFAAKLEGRDPAAEKREAKLRIVADRVEDLLETFIAQRLSQNRSGGEIARLLRREVGKTWGGRSIHEISKRDVVEVVTAIAQRGAPVAANKALKATKTFLRWCVGRAVLDQSPAESVPLPSKEIARDRVLDDNELAHVILAARKMGRPYKNRFSDAPGHHGYQRACDLISGQASTGHLGRQCSHAPGRPILHLVFILSQTSAGWRRPLGNSHASGSMRCSFRPT